MSVWTVKDRSKGGIFNIAYIVYHNITDYDRRSGRYFALVAMENSISFLSSWQVHQILHQTVSGL